MIDIIIDTLLWTYLVLLLISIWLLVCNRRTYKQRIHLITSMTNFDELLAVREVTYERHMWSLITGRNPRKLYSSVIWHTMGWQ